MIITGALSVSYSIQHLGIFKKHSNSKRMQQEQNWLKRNESVVSFWHIWHEVSVVWLLTISIFQETMFYLKLFSLSKKNIISIVFLDPETSRVWVIFSLSGGFMPCRHLQGENIQLYNLFSPVMMITWWMKLGGNRPPGDNPLLFAISGTGSFICPVA